MLKSSKCKDTNAMTTNIAKARQEVGNTETIINSFVVFSNRVDTFVKRRDSSYAEETTMNVENSCTGR
jgi:hypothetical protein